MSIAIGSRLGCYEIHSRLGAGGMGEVYRAHDSKLNRDVALKFLPEALSFEADRLARFKREAQLLASLNHPNVAHIYGLEGESEPIGQAFIVMELVDGEDLAQRIARGPLPLDEVLPIARQIADALEAAHEQGIIHRDLKPANIKLRADGTVKVLDFGLAKALGPPEGGHHVRDGAGHHQVVSGLSRTEPEPPTITAPAMTGIGIILGTAAYMSPEQAKGHAADKRSDIWAFGCVLFEMLTGRRAFDGEDVSDALAAVLRGEPDWTALPTDLPSALDLALRRCLEKDRRRRIADVSTICFLLDDGETLESRVKARVSLELTGHEASADGHVPRWSRWKIRVVVAAVVAAAAGMGGLVAWNARPKLATPVVVRFSVALGQGQTFTNLGDLTLALSPDGTKIAYAANRRLYLRSLSDVDARPIRGTDVNPRHPMFSPDGNSIAYFSPEEKALKRIAVTGGAAVTVAISDSPVAPLGGSWSDNYIFFGQSGRGPNAGIVRVAAAGGKAEVVMKTNPDEFADAPQMLPDGEHLLFTVARGIALDRWEKSQIVVQSLRTGERKVLVDGGSDGRYVKTGHLLYALGGVVFAVRFDTAKLQTIGAPVPIIEGVRRSAGAASGNTQTGVAQYSVSDNGALVFIPGPVSFTGAQLTLMLLDRSGAAEPLKIPPGAYRDPRISPDGKRIAFGSESGREAIVWVYDLAGTSSMRRLTLRANNRFPVWSPDGERLAFQSDREGDLALFVQRADGNGAAQRLTKPEKGTAHVPESWSPDGKWLLFGETTASMTRTMILSVADGEVAPFDDVQSTVPINATFSPDGKWVAYASRRGLQQVFVQPFPPTGAIYQISKSTNTSATHPLWSRDGRELYYIPGPGELVAVTITTHPTFAFSDPRLLPQGPFGFIGSSVGNTRQNDATADGRIVVLVDASAQAGSSGSSPAVEQLQVVLNWREELNARLPVK